MRRSRRAPPGVVDKRRCKPHPLGRQPELAQQRFDLWASTTKLDERFHRIAAAAALQDRLEETPRRLHVVDAVLLEGAESVGREDLGPLVAVVAGGIAAGEDVLKAVRKAVEGRR